jgi:hypothetical protein
MNQTTEKGILRRISVSIFKLLINLKEANKKVNNCIWYSEISLKRL